MRNKTLKKVGSLLLVGVVTLGLMYVKNGGLDLNNQASAKSKIGTLTKTTNVDNLDYLSQLENWSYTENPAYYKSLGLSGLNPSDFPMKGEIVNSPLDELGRSGEARGSITLAMYQKARGHKQSFTNKDNPSGFDTIVNGVSKNWNTVKGQVKMTDGLGSVYSGWFYNRSHSIGDALGGASSRENVTTGTRFQNVGTSKHKGGMRYSESKIENYFKTKGGRNSVVYYQVKPLYKGTELVPRGSLVAFKSTDGILDEKVLVSNSAYGYTIDYNTGNFTAN